MRKSGAMVLMASSEDSTIAASAALWRSARLRSVTSRIIVDMPISFPFESWIPLPPMVASSRVPSFLCNGNSSRRTASGFSLIFARSRVSLALSIARLAGGI